MTIKTWAMMATLSTGLLAFSDGALAGDEDVFRDYPAPPKTDSHSPDIFHELCFQPRLCDHETYYPVQQRVFPLGHGAGAVLGKGHALCSGWNRCSSVTIKTGTIERGKA